MRAYALYPATLGTLSFFWRIWQTFASIIQAYFSSIAQDFEKADIIYV